MKKTILIISLLSIATISFATSIIRKADSTCSQDYVEIKCVKIFNKGLATKMVIPTTIFDNNHQDSTGFAKLYVELRDSVGNVVFSDNVNLVGYDYSIWRSDDPENTCQLVLNKLNLESK